MVEQRSELNRRAVGMEKVKFLTYVSMALQMSDTDVPSFLRVMARFLALLGSSRPALLEDLEVIFLLGVSRSTGGDWALVLNCSSNTSMFSSCNRTS